MRDAKLAEMTSWLCHLLFLDGRGVARGRRGCVDVCSVGPGGALLGGAGGRWGGGKELRVCSQRVVGVCRALRIVHGSEKHLCETVGGQG